MSATRGSAKGPRVGETQKCPTVRWRNRIIGYNRPSGKRKQAFAFQLSFPRSHRQVIVSQDFYQLLGTGA